MTSISSIVIRLKRDRNAKAKKEAARRGITKERYIVWLLERYVAEPWDAPPPTRPLVAEPRVEVRTAVSTDVYEQAMFRARSEGKPGLSAVVEEIIDNEVEQ